MVFSSYSLKIQCLRYLKVSKFSFGAYIFTLCFISLLILQVISSTLFALATLLDVLICLQQERPGFENITTEPKHALKARVAAVSFAEKLFKDHKYFLDFLKSQRPTIRSATYSVLKSLIKNVPQAINVGNIKTVTGAILGAFNEKDPTCHPSMWDVMLLFSRKFPDGWSSLNIQKSILNPLWNFLRNGCFGSQQISYPALILFLDNVPPKSVVGDKFFLEFFKNLWVGRTISLSADRQAFFQALKECYLWSLKNASRYKIFLKYWLRLEDLFILCLCVPTPPEENI